PGRADFMGAPGRGAITGGLVSPLRLPGVGGRGQGGRGPGVPGGDGPGGGSGGTAGGPLQFPRPGAPHRGPLVCRPRGGRGPEGRRRSHRSGLFSSGPAAPAPGLSHRRPGSRGTAGRKGVPDSRYFVFDPLMPVIPGGPASNLISNYFAPAWRESSLIFFSRSCNKLEKLSSQGARTHGNRRLTSGGTAARNPGRPGPEGKPWPAVR